MSEGNRYGRGTEVSWIVGRISRHSNAYVRELHDLIINNSKDLELYIDNPISANYEEKETGNRLVHVAARCGNLDALKLLFRYGANLNLKNFEGNTALHTANSFNNYCNVCRPYDYASNRYK